MIQEERGEPEVTSKAFTIEWRYAHLKGYVPKV